MRSKKIKISVSLDSGLVEWIDKKVSDFTFQNRSDGLEKAVYRLKTETEKTNNTTNNHGASNHNDSRQ
jgi:metal-responsive CopG/Arc/MetJ family transcriptional regulator